MLSGLRGDLWVWRNLLPGHYAYPLDLIREAADYSTNKFETYELIDLLHERHGTKDFRALDLAMAVGDGDREFKAHLEGLTGRRNELLSARSIGRHLQGLRNRRFGDVTLRTRVRDHMCEWKVEVAEGSVRELKAA